MNRDSKNCVLLFVKYPIPGRVKTRLAERIGQDAAAHLYRHFVTDILAVLKNLDANIEIVFSPADNKDRFKKWLGKKHSYVPQSGRDLGKRLKNAFAHAFNEGFKNIIVVGSDSPDLPAKYLELAFDALDKNDAVIGPSSDGGYYLIGFTKNAFLPAAFEQISWSSKAVFKQSVNILKQRGRKLFVLPKWHDLDTVADLEEFIKRNKYTDPRQFESLALIHKIKNQITVYGEHKMAEANTIARTTHEICRSGFTHKPGTSLVDITDKPVWDKIRKAGTRLWLDTGDIDSAKKLWCSQFEALTTNNTLLNMEIQKGTYDQLIKDTADKLKRAAPDIKEKELLLEISFVLNACHALRLVEIFDANVSVELHTDLGDDVERSVEYGKRYFEICPERFYIKVPFTPAGLLATRRLGKLNIPVNFTLGFSARQNYAAALISQPAFVNVFLGRLNAFVADNNLGDGLNVGEKTTTATQNELLKLRKNKRTKTLLIAASMRNGDQIANLAGIDVHTMPPKAAAQYQETHSEEVTGKLQEDLKINLADGITLDDFNASTLWDLPEAFKTCVKQLLKKNMDHLTPKDIQAHFADAGFADFLPQWSEQDIRSVTADGKIPDYKKWTDKLKNAEIGLDALMNISAFYSFATDQEKLDSHIKSLL